MDSLGDRMKRYETQETQRHLMPLLPVYVRLDGRSFSRFTKHMSKPFDDRMHSCMVSTTRHLVKETSACIGYTQSDEISLVLYADDPKSQMFFNGKVFKLASVLAGMASSYFVLQYLNEFNIVSQPWTMKQPPAFDCRVINLPTKAEAANMVLWREQDATKNAITSAARWGAGFSHKALKGKTGAEKQEMMHEQGINFNDYPASFKRGTFVRRLLVQHRIGEEEWNAIPDKHKPPTRLVMRHDYRVMEMPVFSRVINREGVIFHGNDPELEKKPIVRGG